MGTTSKKVYTQNRLLPNQVLIHKAKASPPEAFSHLDKGRDAFGPHTAEGFQNICCQTQRADAFINYSSLG